MSPVVWKGPAAPLVAEGQALGVGWPSEFRELDLEGDTIENDANLGCADEFGRKGQRMSRPGARGERQI